jgi:hypothetical protein
MIVDVSCRQEDDMAVRSIQYAVLISMLVAMVSYAQQDPAVPEITGEDELVKEKGRFDEVWVNPEADIAHFDKLYLWQDVFQFREGGDTKTGTTTEMLRGNQGPYAIGEEDQERFKKIVSEAVATQLGQSKQFEIVKTVGPQTLLVRAAFLDIVSNVPPNNPGITKVYLADVGEATFVIELIDAETGVMLARVAERRRIEPPGSMNRVSTIPTTSATVWNTVTMWANDVARDLRQSLDRAKKKAGT